MVLVNFVTPQKFLGRQILLIDALPPGYISSFLGLQQITKHIEKIHSNILIIEDGRPRRGQ